MIGSGHPSLSLQPLYTLNISFASGTARITALFSAFAAILVAMGAPIPFTILLFGLMNSPGCTLTHYSSGVTPIFFGAGYVPQGTWWRVGLAISVVSFLIHFWGWYPWYVAIRYSIIFKNPSQ